MKFVLERLTGSSTGTDSGSAAGSAQVIIPPPPPPPQVNCIDAILEPRNKACIKQFCAAHPNDDKCQVE